MEENERAGSIGKNRRRGREPKLTRAVEATIVESIRNCATFETAATLAGITYRTFRNWMTWGEAGKRPYVQFFQAVTRAEHEAEVALIQTWREAAKVDWRAARDMLARRFPGQWGQSKPEPPAGLGLSIHIHLGEEDQGEQSALEVPYRPALPMPDNAGCKAPDTTTGEE